MERTVTPEWLDDLPAANTAAMRSRKDLWRLNLLMGHARILTKVLRRQASGRPRKVADLGAGDGSLMLRMARELTKDWPAVEVALVDRQPVVSPNVIREFAELGWRAKVCATDVQTWLESDEPDSDVILANLFLHHFDTGGLTPILAGAARRTRCFVALEPRRSRTAYWFSRWVGLAGCNHVTRHDAPVSVRAGFSGTELSRLWTASETGWSVEERSAGLFSHLFVAVKPGAG